MSRSEEIAQSEFLYQELRKEMLQNEQLALQTMSATTLLIAATISVAFSQFIPSDLIRALLFYGAGLLAFFSLFHSAIYLGANRHLGYFLARFVEPNLSHINWEARQTLWSRLHPPTPLSFVSGRRLPAFTLVVISFVLGTYFVWRFFGPTRVTDSWVVTAVAAYFTLWLTVAWRRRYLGIYDLTKYDCRYDKIVRLETAPPP